MSRPDARTRPRMRMGTKVAWIAMGAISVVCLVVGATRSVGPATAEDRVNVVAETIKCPTCQGESVADSNAPTSREIRQDIADRVARGETPNAIRAVYAERYGDAILLTPSGSGLTALVWILPVVAVVLAVAGLVFVFKRWRDAAPMHPSDDDRVLVARALDELDGRERPS